MDIRKRSAAIPTILVVLTIAFTACHTLSIERTSDGSGSMVYFKEAVIGEKAYLEGSVNFVKCNYSITYINVSLLGDYPRPLQVGIYSKTDCGVKEGDRIYVIGVKTNTAEMIAYMINIEKKHL